MNIPLPLGALIGPPGASAEVDSTWLDHLAGRVDEVNRLAGTQLDAVRLLTERAELLGHRGWGSVSAGGSCRMVSAADGWLAVNLPRLEDLDAVPAWLEVDPIPDGQVWNVVDEAAGRRSRAELIRRAIWLGLAVAAIPDRVVHHKGAAARSSPGAPRSVGDEGPAFASATPTRPRRGPLVVDLSALWAGPLCGAILAEAGAEVTKIESTGRPDGSRAGTPEFYRRLNGAKTVVDLDLGTHGGRAELRRQVAAADIVIEASRPRALSHLGVSAEAEVARGAIWVSITGYGRAGPAGERVAFGDDAAAAGGLLAWDPAGHPWFVGDAAADPITGVDAARLALRHVAQGQAGLLDVGMVPSVAELTGSHPVDLAERSEPPVTP